MDNTTINKGMNLSSAFQSIRDAKLPAQPNFRSYTSHDHVEDHFYDLKDVIGTNDHPVVISAMWNAILKSDHPTIQEEVRKLYMIAKLCVGSDDEDLEEAIDSVRETDRINKDIDEQNLREQKRYDQECKIREDQIEATRDEFRRWWDNFVGEIEAQLKAANNKDERFGKVWPQLIRDVLNQHIGRLYFKPLAKWDTKKALDLSLWRSEHWPSFSTLHEFARKVLDSLELGHRAFITRETNALIDVIHKSKEYKENVRYIRDRFDRYDFYWNKIKRYGGTKYFKEDDSYVYDYSYTDPYDSYGKHYLSAQDQMHDALATLDNEVRKKAEEIIHRRHLDGVDGYNCIYQKPIEINPAHESW